MSENNKPKILTEEQQYADQKPLEKKKPDEMSGLNIEAHFRIYDPESGDTLVQGRA